MLELAGVLFGGLFTVAAALSAGRAVWRGRPAPPWPVAFGLGCALLSTALFFLHQFGWMNRWTAGLAGVVALAAGWRRPRLEWPGKAWLAGLPFLILYLVHALAPETQPDAITYHLGLVSEWNREGGFTRRVGFYEVLPQGLEMLFSMAFAFGGHSAAKLVHLSFVIATVALIAEAAWRLKTRNGAAAALLYGCAPVVGVAGASAYTDAGWAFAVAAAFYALLRWDRDGGREWIAIAGAMAGFAYAAKLPGIVIAPALVGWLGMRRRWREAALAAAAAAAVGAPWMIRAAAVSGNPVAPLFNRWFENPHFHASTEESVRSFLRSYETSAMELPLEVTLRGAKTAGLAGPAFLLAPLGLLALRRREGRWAWLACGIAAIPWFVNAGTRFLMPALVLLALALVMALPARAAWTLAAIQMAAAWPAVMDLWTAPGAWRLRGFPAAAALRIEPERDYLRRVLWEYRVAELIERHTRRGDQILDLEVAPPSAYFEATAVTWWQSAAAGRALDALRVGVAESRDAYWSGVARWDREALEAVRLRLRAPASIEHGWSLQEITFFDRERALFPSSRWALEASANPWEAGLAFDRNPVSRWQSRRAASRDDFLTVHFPEPLALNAARVLVFEPPRGLAVMVEGRGAGATAWKALGELSWRAAPALNYRARAMSMVKREGFRYVLTRSGEEGLPRVGKDLVESAGSWGLRKVGESGGVYLLTLD